MPFASQGPEPRQRWSAGIMSGRYLMCQWLQDVRKDPCRKEAKIPVAGIACCETCAPDAARVSLELWEAAAGLEEYLGDQIIGGIERP